MTHLFGILISFTYY